MLMLIGFSIELFAVWNNEKLMLMVNGLCQLKKFEDAKDY